MSLYLSWFLIKPIKLASVLVILRLACLLSKQRHLSTDYDISLGIKSEKIICQLPKKSLDEDSLLYADLMQEQEQLSTLDIKLVIR